jgi:tetratricopeptide (TPR) repeat protein
MEQLAKTVAEALASQDWSRAEQGLRQMIEQSGPEIPASLAYNLGLTLKHKGDLAASGAWFERALEADPEHQNARFELASWLMEQERLQQAYELFAAYLANQKDDYDALLNQARLARRLGKNEEAEALLVRLLPLVDERLEVALLAADLAQHRGDQDDASRYFAMIFSKGAPPLRAAALKILTGGVKGSFPLNAYRLREVDG